MTDSGSPACAACGARRVEKAFDSVEPGFSVLRCRDCGAGRTWPHVPDEEIGRYYPATYYGRENVRFNRLFEEMTRLFQQRRSRVLFNRVGRGPVLDVGCGRGFLLNFLRELGYEAHGTELSDASAWHARNRLKLDVKTGDFLKADLPKGKFHAVVFWHTLEHFPRPDDAVARAAELIQSGGLVAIAVPNFESLQARLFGSAWFHLDVPRHYHHFGAKSLEILLARHRFRVVQLDHFCLEQNPYGWLQSFYNRLGFDNNFLYSLLKDKSARTTDALAHPMQTALTAILLAPLLAASFAMTLVEAAVRRGGTIEVYALKE